VDRAIAMLVALQTNPPASMPADTQQALEQTLQRARQVREAADTARVNAALEKLRATPDDAQTRQTIVELGPRAIPTLRSALRATLSAEQPDPAAERRLHDLLKAIVPAWSGFAPDTAPPDKLKALDQIQT
jgi:hypothetical protein